MMKTAILQMLLMLAAAGALFAQGRDTPESLDQAWIKAFRANDVDGMVACYATDAIAWEPNSPPAQGKDAIRRLFTSMAGANTFKDVTLLNTHYQNCGEMAVAWSEFNLTMVPKAGGSPVTMQGRFVEVMKKENGQWVYAVDHASASPPKQHD